MHRLTFSPKIHYLAVWLWMIMPIVMVLALRVGIANAAGIDPRSLTIANDLPGVATSYNLNFGLLISETIGSVEIQFCSNSPLLQVSCVAPTGFSVAAANLTTQSGPGGFAIAGSSNTNTLILSRSPTLFGPGNVDLNFTNVVNPSLVGPFYARLLTFATSDASGSANSSGGLALVINNAYSVSAYVPPYLLFCVGVVIANLNCANASGNYLNFGYLSSQSTSASQSQMLIATNAQNGYSVQVSGGTMTSGNNVIAALSSGSVSLPGTNQFGINLVANSRPAVGLNPQGPGVGSPLASYAQSNVFQYSNGSVIASANQASNLREYTISYILNIASNQAPGYYATTLTYIGIGNF